MLETGTTTTLRLAPTLIVSAAHPSTREDEGSGLLHPGYPRSPAASTVSSFTSTCSSQWLSSGGLDSPLASVSDGLRPFARPTDRDSTNVQPPSIIRTKRAVQSTYETALSSVLQEMRLDEIASGCEKFPACPLTPSPKHKLRSKAGSSPTTKKVRSSLQTETQIHAGGRSPLRSPARKAAEVAAAAILPVTPVSIRQIRKRALSHKGPRHPQDGNRADEFVDPGLAVAMPAQSRKERRRLARSKVDRYDPSYPPPCPPPTEAVPPTPASIVALINGEVANPQEDDGDFLPAAATYSAQRVVFPSAAAAAGPRRHDDANRLRIGRLTYAQKEQTTERDVPSGRPTQQAPIGGTRQRLLSLFRGTAASKSAPAPAQDLKKRQKRGNRSATEEGSATLQPNDHEPGSPCHHRKKDGIPFPSTEGAAPRIPSLALPSLELLRDQTLLQPMPSTATYQASSSDLHGTLLLPASLQPGSPRSRVQSPVPSSKRRSSTSSTLRQSPCRFSPPIKPHTIPSLLAYELDRKRRNDERIRTLALLEGQLGRGDPLSPSATWSKRKVAGGGGDKGQRSWLALTREGEGQENGDEDEDGRIYGVPTDEEEGDLPNLLGKEEAERRGLQRLRALRREREVARFRMLDQPTPGDCGGLL